MAQYGIQPNGKIRLDDGTMWDPNDPLPPEAVPAFNSTPMGNPLLPSTLPRAQMPSAPSPIPPAATPPMPTMAPVPQRSPVSTMSGYTSPTFASSLFQGMGQPSPTMPRGMFGAQPAPPAKPSFFGEGGTGRNLAGIIGDALLAANNHSLIYAPAREKQIEYQKAAFQQQQELLRQLALAQYKQAHPDPGSIETNYNFLTSKDPSLGTSYLRAEANPMTLMTDPTTQAVGFYPKGGYPSAPVSKTLADGTTAYWVNGAWYDNPEGK